MPRRPPKKWWRKCTESVEGRVTDSAKVCGYIWREMKSSTKKRILKKE